MSILNVSLDNGKINITDNSGGLMLSLPFDLSGQADADQWLRNFYRVVGYAYTNSGRKLSKEETKARANTILATPEVKAAIEGNSSFWTGKTAGTRQSWFYDAGIIERPAPVVPPTEKPGPTTNPTGPVGRKGSSLTWLYILIAILLGIGAFFYFFPHDKAADDKAAEAGATLEEQGKEAKRMVDRCVTIVGQPGIILSDLMEPKKYYMIDYPFRSFIDEMVEQGGAPEGQTLHQAAFSEMERRLVEWQARCNCELTINCPE